MKKNTILKFIQDNKIRFIILILSIIFIAPTVTQAQSNAYVGTISHVFNDDTDTDTSWGISGNIINVVSESKSAPEGLISTGYEAKHYTITFNKNYDNISITDIAESTASGVSRNLYVARTEKLPGNVWRVWFNIVDLNVNSYVRSFNITTPNQVPTVNYTNNNVGTISHVFNDDTDTDTSWGISGNIINVVSESKSAPGGLISTGYEAKHYTITFNKNYDNISITDIAGSTASGVSRNLYVARTEKLPGNVWRVWFNLVGFNVNSYVRSFNITTPNQVPTVNYTNTTAIDYSTARANWSYSDPEGDVQTISWVQVSTDAVFSNIVFSQAQLGDSTNMSISGLAPSTTYHIRVQTWNNENGESGWITGGVFTTKINNPPNLDQLSCGGAGTGYTTGQINWNYTGTDESGDELVLKARWKRNLDTDWTLVDLPYNTKSGNIDISNLISGYPYNIEVSLNDNRNSHLGNRWKGCGTLTPENYPEPVVDFSVSKFGDDSTSKTNGQTLELKTGDKLRARWDITETAGLDSCTLSTEGGDLVAGNGFNGNITNNVIDSTSDLSYTIKLNCTGKPANINRAFEQRINVIVLSYPKVSCSIEDDKKSVKTGDSNINIKPVVENVSGLYNWEVKKDVSETAIFRQGTGTIPNPMRLDYTGLEFGRYNPWIKVSVNRPGNPVVTRESTTTCPAIVNFGNSNIREISP